MDRDQMIDLARRAVTLSRDKTTDMAPTEAWVPAAHYTDPERFAREKKMVEAAPQLVGYVSELPEPNSYVTKEVMGRPILLTRQADGTVAAFDNVCLHRQAPVAQGCGVARTFTCPYHAWTYANDGRLRGAPGSEGFPTTLAEGPRLRSLPATECAGFLWVSLDPGIELDIPTHLGPLAAELESWGIGGWSSIGVKVLDSPINWKLAIDTFAENYHFATVHKTTFAQIAKGNTTVFDEFGLHHRLIFPLNNIDDLDGKPEETWKPLQSMVVIYALFPNIVLSCTMANGELFRTYPGTDAGHSITYHQNSTPLDLTDEATRAGADAIFDYAHATVRDEDFAMVEGLQRTMASGARENLVFGRNEPGLQQRHTAWASVLEKQT